MNKISTILALFLVIAGEVSSQGPPVFIDSPIMLGLQGRGIRTFGKFIAGKQVNVYQHSVIVPYNILTNTQIGVVVPFVSKSVKGNNSYSGLGDIRVFLKQLLFKKDGKGKTFRTIGKLTEIFPSGNAEKEPSLGNGNYQTDFAVVSGYITLKHGIFGSVGYTLNSGASEDVFHYELAFGKPLLPQQYPPKQLNIYFGINGSMQTETNAHLLLASPAVQYIFGKRILLETGVQFPLLKEDTENFRIAFIFGTRVLIF